MAKFSQEIEFFGNFKSVQDGADKIGDRAAKHLEGAYARVLKRLSNVQTTLGRVTSRLADGVNKSLREGMAGLKPSLAGVTGAVASGLGAATDAIGDMIERADKLSKLKVFDSTTYQRLAIAADKGGASIADIERASMSLNKSLGAAKMSEGFERAINDAGLSVQQLKSLKPEEQFRLIADAVAEIADPAEKARLSVALLGASGAKLVPMLSAGGDAIKQIGDTAQEEGRIISEQAITAAAGINDSLDAIKGPLEGITTQLLTSVLPPIAQGLELLVGIFKAHSDEIFGAVNVVIGIVQSVADVVLRVVEIVAPVFEVLVEQIGRISSSFVGLFEQVGEGDGIFMQVVDTLASWLIPTIETLGDIVTWIIDDALSPLLSLFTEIFNVVLLVIDKLSFLQPIVEAVGAVFKTVGGIVLDITTGAFGDFIGALRTVVGLLDTFLTGTWEDAFKSLGSAILDFVLWPFRKLVSAVIAVADALGGEDIIPDSVRAFAGGETVADVSEEDSEAMARGVEKGKAMKDAVLAWYGEQKAAADVEAAKPKPGMNGPLAREGAAYGPSLPPGFKVGKPSTTPKPGSRPGGAKGGKAADAAKKDATKISIAARGVMLELTGSPAPVAPAPVPTTPAPLTMVPSMQGSSGDVYHISVPIEINGAQVENTAQTAATLTKAVQSAMAETFNRVTRAMPARRKT